MEEWREAGVKGPLGLDTQYKLGQAVRDRFVADINFMARMRLSALNCRLGLCAEVKAKLLTGYFQWRKISL